jgi:hypothetical protein
VQIDCANTSVTSIRWDMRRVADDSVRQLHFGDDSGECEATAGLQHASADDQKNANPLQRHEFQGEKKVIYTLWSIPSFRHIDTEPTEMPHATTERRAD